DRAAHPRWRHGGGGRTVRARAGGGVARGRYAGFVVPAGPGGHDPLRQRGDDGGHDDGAPGGSLKHLAETGVAWITLAGRPPDVFSGVPGMQWGRLQVDVNCALRRGAWYRVARLASLEAILDVKHRPLKVPHYLVQVVSRTPTRMLCVQLLPRVGLNSDDSEIEYMCILANLAV